MKTKLLIALGFLVSFGVFAVSISSPTAKQSSPTATAISETPTVPPSIYSDSIPKTPENQEIMRAIERAYDIEAKAAYTFDLSKFPTVFINDPRFNVDPN